jgi:hypothetical protein
VAVGTILLSSGNAMKLVRTAYGSVADDRSPPRFWTELASWLNPCIVFQSWLAWTQFTWDIVDYHDTG